MIAGLNFVHGNVGADYRFTRVKTALPTLEGVEVWTALPQKKELQPSDKYHIPEIAEPHPAKLKIRARLETALVKVDAVCRIV